MPATRPAYAFSGEGALRSLPYPLPLLVPLVPGEQQVDELPLPLLVPGEEQMDEFLRMTLYTVQ